MTREHQCVALVDPGIIKTKRVLANVRYAQQVVSIPHPEEKVCETAVLVVLELSAMNEPRLAVYVERDSIKTKGALPNVRSVHEGLFRTLLV